MYKILYILLLHFFLLFHCFLHYLFLALFLLVNILYLILSLLEMFLMSCHTNLDMVQQEAVPYLDTLL